MITVTDPYELQKQALAWRAEGQTIGFVPTMGFLHEGHLSLVKEARKKTAKVIVSIFVNPTQFGPNEDLESYPRDEARDAKLLIEAGADILFLPTPGTMYDADAATWVEVPSLATHLCAGSRPTHFRGVCTVVAKLFLLAQPHIAFFGEKDWQQLAILRRMAKDLMFPIDVVGCPIVREKDGLAKSSRNVNLTEDERTQAVHIHKALSLATEMTLAGEQDAEKILSTAKAHIETHIPLGTIDYLEAMDSKKITPIEKIGGKVLFAAAVKFSVVRLIDNQFIEIKG